MVVLHSRWNLRIGGRLSGALVGLAVGGTACSANGPVDDDAFVGGGEEANQVSADGVSGTLPLGSTLRTTGNVNFRSGASKAYEVIDVLVKGTDVVTVNRTTSENAYWNVELDGTTGWVHGNYLKLVSSGGATGGSGGGTGGTGGTGVATGGSGGASGGGGSGGGAGGSAGGVPAYATFHLNYTGDKDWSKCAERDFVVFDMFDSSAVDFAKCKGMGARMLCYFSSQYEDWRPDAGDFGQLGSALDGWAGEKWVKPSDPANLAVMIARLDMAVTRGCEGIDLDNVDHDGHESYVMKIFDAARSKGLLVSQKNAVEKIGLFWDKVDMYQNEQCQQYDECSAYEGLGRPVYNIEYSACKTVPYLYSNRKDVEAMDAWEGACSP